MTSLIFIMVASILSIADIDRWREGQKGVFFWQLQWGILPLISANLCSLNSWECVDF
jgi:hypothetical protein